MKKALFQKDILAAVVSGILFATSYPPFPAWALFFCFVPVWVALYRAKSLKRVALIGFVNQFVFTLIGFNWIAHTAIEYGHIPFILSWLILIGFCLFASLNVMFAAMISWYLKEKFSLKGPYFFILLAVTSASLEWFYPRIFSWNMAYSLLFSHFHTSQLAEYVGFNLLSVLVNLANACFAIAVVTYPQKGWSRALVIFVVALFLTEMLGARVEKNLGVEDKNIHVLMVQPNIGNYDKLYAERGAGYQAPVISKDFEVTNQGLNASPVKPDLIVWPETALPVLLDPYFAGQMYHSLIFDFARSHHVRMIVGAYSGDNPSANHNPRDYNALFAIDENGMPQPAYRKRILLAFGEYFPGADYFPFLKKIVPEISDFGRGDGPAIFQFNDVSFEPLICYEGLDTQFVGESAKLNPSIFLNVTNDSWFGRDFEPYQHMIMTVARTIEYRRPMIRVTNTGFSIVADARGKILIQSPQEVEWAQTTDVPYFSQPKVTFYSLISPYLSWIFLVLVAGTVLLGKVWMRRENHRA